MPFREEKTPYTPIDTDPHFTRVIRYMRPSDLGVFAAGAAIAPATYYWVDLKMPAGSRTLGIRAAAVIGIFGGFLLAYQRSSFRFWGHTENSREIEMDHNEYLDARKKGLPHHLGSTNMDTYLQSVSARHSRFSALKFSWLPWFNFVHHNQCVNWDLYKDLQQSS